MGLIKNVKLFPHSQYRALEKEKMGVGQRESSLGKEGGGWVEQGAGWMLQTFLVAFSCALLCFTGVLH